MLRLPGREVDHTDAVSKETASQELAAQAAKEFVLWEVTNASIPYY